MNRARTSFVFAATLSVTSVSRAIVAFPGAEGFGANATGGRGGNVYHVTSLADTNTAGTLRNAISTAPASGRTIVLDVSGTINLASRLTFSKPNLTIAGQTAPGPGITITGWESSVTASNVIVRYVKFRPGDTNAPFNKPTGTNIQGDSLNVQGGSSSIVNNVIIDHVSTSWGVDECLSATWCNNVTVQNSIIAECLANAGHLNDAETGPEEHSMGSLIRYGSGQITYSHNLYESNGTRNPRVGDNVKLDFVNNVVYNYVGQSAYSGSASEGTTVLNYRGNYTIAGPSTASSTSRAFQGGSTNTVIYQTGNFIDGNRNGVLDGSNTGWAMIQGSYTQGTGTFPQASVPVTFDTAQAAYAKVLATAGASMVRDPIDTRIVNNLATQPGKNGSVIDSQNQVGGWDPTPGASRPAGFDTDNDGMPNTWELDHGTNPAAADNNLLFPDGYTALEHYLYWLVPSIPGDATGDMLITRDDYAATDRGFAKHLGGWYDGDFNSDGAVTVADYLVLDTAYAGTYGLSLDLLAARAAQFGNDYVEALTGIVPEPSFIATLFPVLAAFSHRRRR